MSAKPHITDEKIAEIQRLKSEGKTYKEICETAGVSHSTVTRACNKGKEPASAATAASSEKNVDENISASIVTENTVDVKTPEEIPEIVLKALVEQLENLYRCKKEIEANREILNNDIDKLRNYIRCIGYENVLAAEDVLMAIDSNIRRSKEENSV